MWTLIDIRILPQYFSMRAVYVSIPCHIIHLICQKTVDFHVGIFSPLLKFLTPGRQQAIMCIPHFNGIWWVYHQVTRLL
jgi:hypothetical protein